MLLPKRLKDKLDERKENNSFRSLRIRGEGIDFFSNDYLGLANKEYEGNGARGATGSRLISGHNSITEDLELVLARFFEAPSALLFNSGYDANLGFFSSVPQRGDTILYDSFIHASIRDGIRLSFAQAVRFDHNDLSDLKEKLSKATGTIYVAVESIYSMDGDQAPLEEIAALCETYNAFLFVDEAHAAGIFGDSGKGLVHEKGLTAKVFARLVTFGKAFGSHGATILGGSDLREYLINYSRSLIYTTALPPQSQKRILWSIQTVSNADDEREILKSNIAFFRKNASLYKIPILSSQSSIQGVLVPGNKVASALAKRLIDKGFEVKAILSPTVPKGGERIRICIHAFNTEKELLDLIKEISQLI